MSMLRWYSRRIQEHRRQSRYSAWKDAFIFTAAGLVMVVEAVTEENIPTWVVWPRLLVLALGAFHIRQLRSPLPPEEHNTSVFIDEPDYFVARCSCVWEGAERTTLHEAVHDARKHAPDAEPALDR